MYINQKDWSEWYKLNEIDYYKNKFSFYTGKRARTTKNKSESSSSALYFCFVGIVCLINFLVKRLHVFEIPRYIFMYV